MSRLDQRSALQTLTKARLIEIASGFDLSIAQSYPKDEFIDGIAASRRASFEKVLEVLTRNELKEICRAHDLDERGREKQILIDRILGREAPRAQDAGPGYSPSLLDEPRGPSAKVRARGKRSTSPAPGTAKRAKTSSGLDDAAWSSGTKNRLRRFALDAPSRYRGPDGDVELAADLIRCFGWGPDEALPAEIPAIKMVVEHGQRRERKLTAELRARRAIVQVIDRDRSMSDAWRELMPILVDLEQPPQYVLLSDYRDVELYDLARDRMTPRLRVAFEELAKYSEAFPFLSRDWSPGATPKIVDDEKVSKQVADLVAKVYRSFKADNPKRGDDVIRFTLQCIVTMFAEDVGLLPRAYFTTLLYEGAEHGDLEARLTELFREMSTPPGSGPRRIRYFNGGLFEHPVLLPIREPQLRALIRAAEADWRYVDPHIFGSVFQGIMDDAERHATGAHYTAKEDIMRVVGPTIVEPWRKRIDAAGTLTELRELRLELAKFRVLDPACGSGNFLYIAFRELYRLETHILARMHEFTSVAERPKQRSAWGSGIPTTNFYGIDINRFAVELARATLNLAKKIAFDERQEAAFEKFGQVELDLDPSLPLDNLEGNIVCDDALFCEWPEVEAIVSNPPFLGGLKVRSELGVEYLERLQATYGGVNGRADFCAYWFRRAHDRLRIGGRAGLVATNTVREGNTRDAATDYILRNGGTIVNAVSSRDWPGDAVVHVSMVNWLKGVTSGPFQLIVEGRVYQKDFIASHLQLHADLGQAREIAANRRGTSQGIVLGTKEFQISRSEALALASDARARPFIKALALAKNLLRGDVAGDADFVLDLARCGSEAEARRAGAAFSYLRRNVLPVVEEKARTTTTEHYRRWLRSWWRPFWPRDEFFRSSALRGKSRKRIIACSRHAARSIFVFLSMSIFPTESLQLFAFDDDYSFGVLQSALHWSWAVAKGSRIKEDTRYTGEVWETFPWPQAPRESAVLSVAEAARALRQTRRDLMDANNWSLRALYQAAEVPGPHPLKDAQARLDEAVAAAYDMPADQEPLEFLLELNLSVAEDEQAGHPVLGPGLPPSLDPRDARWLSDDCIEPPPLDKDKANA